MIILGIDPGTATTGYGILKWNRKNKITVVDYGCISTSKDLLATDRLKQIEKELNSIVKKYQPQAIAMERLFFFKNPKTVIPVAQAEGIILLVAAKKKIPFYEFTPLQMKLAITGYGRAQKSQVQKMIKKILNLDKLPKPDDAADALGIAICCIYHLEKGLDR